MSKKPQWHIDVKDTYFSMTTSSRSGRHGSNWANKPASFNESEREIKITHKETKISVTAKIPVGNYTNKQIKKETEELKLKLYKKLEQKVAKELRIPGISF